MADRPNPSPAAMLIGTAIISIITGYMIGIASSLGFLPIPFQTATAPVGKRSRTSNYDDEEESSEEEIDDGLLDHAPNWANGEAADRRDGLRVSAKEKPVVDLTDNKTAQSALQSTNEECKLVLVVRTDLGMTKGTYNYSPTDAMLTSVGKPGKIAAQCSHATLACYKDFMANDPRSAILRRWERQGQAKIALQVKSEDELAELQAKAMSLGLVAHVIADAGRTQIASGSHTVLGIGPAPKSAVDAVTGHLKLL